MANLWPSAVSQGMGVIIVVFNKKKGRRSDWTGGLGCTYWGIAI